MTANAAPSAKPYLQIQGLVKKFGDNYAVDHIDLDIEQHEIFALLGSSGSGKSTLLRMLAGMETPNQGKIILDGQDITGLAPYERPINMMFQSYALFPHMTVEQNIAFGLDTGWRNPKHRRLPEAVSFWLERMQLSEIADHYPHQISGGQRQRTALARSCIPQPRWLLLDEPFSALDPDLRHQMRELVADVQQELKIPMLMISHDLADTQALADEVIRMEDGILQYDRVEIR